MKDLRAPRIFIGVVLMATAAIAVVNEVVTQRAFDAADREIDVFALNALPSVVQLEKLRQALKHLDDAARDGAQERALALFEQADLHYRQYKTFPAFPDEPPLQVRCESALAVVRAALEASLGQGHPLNPQAVHVTIAAADHVAEAILELNVRQAMTAARLLASEHAHEKELSLLLLFGSFLAMLVAGVLAERLLARAAAALRKHIADLDAFGARVAHDLRNILTPLPFALASLCQDSVLCERSRRNIAIAEAAHRRAVALIDDLLAFARSGRGDTSARARVREAVAEVVARQQLLAESEHAQLSAADVPADLEVATSESVLVSVIGNLARNAILYLGSSANRVVTVMARADGNAVRICIEDTGPGIPQDVLVRLFRPFERGSERPGGSGLGLATVKRLVEAHGGRTAARSQVGLGSVFEVTLPRAPSATS